MKQSSNTNVESKAIYSALAGGIIGFLVGLVTFVGGNVEIFSRGLSLGFVVTILASVLSLVIYLIVTMRHAKSTKSLWRFVLQHVDSWAVSIVHGLLAFLSCAVIFYIINASFIGARLDVWAASIISGLICGTICYITYLSAKHMNSMLLSIILALFLLSGTFVSMLTASDPLWWYQHFSSLGASGGVSGYAFNATLIIAGVVIMALAKYVTRDLYALQSPHPSASDDKKIRVFQSLLATIGLALAGVGLFVYDVFPLTHKVAASGLAVLFLLIIMLLPWLVPHFPKAYFIASYLLLAGLMVSVWLFAGVGYFNLTAFEMVAAGIIFTWIIIFVRHLAAMVQDSSAADKTH